MSRYAANTSVSTDASQAELRRTLQRYGADQFMFGEASARDDQAARAVVEFRMHGKRVRFILPMPDLNATEFQLTPSKRLRRSEQEAYRAWEQACRQRWRALNLTIKAKLEAVEVGIAEFEEEFLAHIVLPGNATVGEWMLPQIEKAYLTGRMPELLPMLPAHEER